MRNINNIFKNVYKRNCTKNDKHAKLFYYESLTVKITENFFFQLQHHTYL